MEYTRLGTSGLEVSRIALGCMSFSSAENDGGWALDADAAEPLFRQAVESGITFWDTANFYGHGTSEEITGEAVRRYTSRDQVVLATKLFAPMGTGPGGRGLSRRAVVEQLDASLRRLGTDYVDLYQIHRFDPRTPVEETMEALHDMVKAGKVRYGAAPGRGRNPHRAGAARPRVAPLSQRPAIGIPAALQRSPRAPTRTPTRAASASRSAANGR